MPPSLAYKMETRVEEVMGEVVAKEQTLDESIQPKVIRIFVTKERGTVPILAATINMPTTELIF